MNLLKTLATVSGMTLVSRVLGYVRDAVVRATANLQRYVATNKLGTGDILEPRTGTLRRALFSRTGGSGDEYTGTVGFDLGLAPYARVQEKGGTIVPRNGTYLTIPIGEALTGKGVADGDALAELKAAWAEAYRHTPHGRPVEL
jgi:hypothetical protein